MNLVVDANIPLAADAFAQFGEVTILPGRNLTPDQLRHADALIVRSITKVTRELLEGTPVRFVGTATIGIDHLDVPWLESAGIAWSSAAGCNARSVVEWVLTALADHLVHRGEDWKDRTLGIIGHGNIGSRLAPVARALGMRVLINDPPLHRSHPEFDNAPLGQLIEESDFITTHVPLTKSGPCPTRHLLNAELLARLKPGAVVINAARGPVLDNAAALAARPDITFLLDIFESEPTPVRTLVERCFIATPHIAGYSHEGKVNGTRMIAEAVARWAGGASTWQPRLAAPLQPVVEIPAQRPPLAQLLCAMQHAYPIRTDDSQLRAGLGFADDAWGAHFDALRKNYPQRREFSNYTGTGATDARVREDLGALGFGIAE